MMFFDNMVKILCSGFNRFLRSMLILGLFLFIIMGLTLNTMKANALAKSKDKHSQETAASVAELDEAALKESIAQRIRISRGVQDQRFKEFSPDLLTIDRKIPFQAQGIPFFAVKIKILSPPPGTDAESISLVVDKSGTLVISDIQELASGKSMAQEALNQLIRGEDFPPDFGKEIFKGTGKNSMIVISDPFCPYCRKGWEYVKTQKEKLKSMKLAHFPLNRPAEIACMVMADSYDRKFKVFEIVDFAYTRLNTNPDPENIVKQFMDAFPELKEIWGKESSAALKSLEEKYQAVVQKEGKTARDLGINSTPLFIVNNELIKGFNPEKLEKAMQ